MKAHTPTEDRHLQPSHFSPITTKHDLELACRYFAWQYRDVPNMPEYEAMLRKEFQDCSSIGLYLHVDIRFEYTSEDAWQIKWTTKPL